MRLCIYKYYLPCTAILGSVPGIFRHIQELFASILTHIQNLVYPWHIQNLVYPWHIQNLVYPGIFKALVYSYHQAFLDFKLYS